MFIFQKKLTKTLILSFSILLNTCFAQLEWTQYKELKLSKLDTIHGWCTKEKAEDLMDLILEHQPEICVEIGVFGGSSIYPTAHALKYNNTGNVYAIDPWENEDCCIGYDPKDANFQWWNSIDLEEIYDAFKVMLKQYKLTNFCKILRMTSDEAISHFKNNSIDILHIDGNHSQEIALNDAKNYLPKVKSSGYIWFDDVNWVTTNLAVSYLLEYCDLDPNFQLSDPYILLRKR